MLLMPEQNRTTNLSKAPDQQQSPSEDGQPERIAMEKQTGIFLTSFCCPTFFNGIKLTIYLAQERFRECGKIKYQKNRIFLEKKKCR